MRSFIGWRCFLLLLLVFILPHLFSVLELHQNVMVKDPSNKGNKKFDHLVLESAAGQGLPNRLQCQGTKALNKTHFPTTSNVSYNGDGISLVTVFTIYNTSIDSHDGRSSNLVTVGNASYSKTQRSMAILNIFINFIQVTMPQSNVIILTDPASGLSVPRDKVIVQSIQGEYSRDKLMLQRIRSYIVRAHGTKK